MLLLNPDGERAQDYGQDLDNLEEEIAVLKEEAHDIYDLRYEDADHYGLPVFEYEGAEYAVGDDDMADEAAWDQVDNLIDDIGYWEDLLKGLWIGMLMEMRLLMILKIYFWDDMNENPEDYLDEDDDREINIQRC